VGWTDFGILRFSVWLRPAFTGGSVLEVNHNAENAVQDNLFMTAIEISDVGISGKGRPHIANFDRSDEHCVLDRAGPDMVA
jgi:hypothetical protein